MRGDRAYVASENNEGDGGTFPFCDDDNYLKRTARAN